MLVKFGFPDFYVKVGNMYQVLEKDFFRNYTSYLSKLLKK